MFQTQTSKEVKQVQEDKQKMTEHFIQTLPTLLQRYGADAEKLANLMAIPQYFDLVVYTNSRQEQVKTISDSLGYHKTFDDVNFYRFHFHHSEFKNFLGENGQYNAHA